MRKLTAAGMLITTFCLLPTIAYAYFDPNATSILFQIFAPMISVVVSAWLLAKERIVRLVARFVATLKQKKS